MEDKNVLLTENTAAKSEKEVVIEKPNKKNSWGKKNVSRKFLIAALAVTLVLNTALSAGVMALFAKNGKAARPDMPNMGRPGSGWNYDDNQNGNNSGNQNGNWYGDQNGNWYGDGDDSKIEEWFGDWNDSQNGNRLGNQDDSQNGNWYGDQNGSQDSARNQSSKASIGIVITENNGVYVAQVNGENAKKAGFAEGDKIVSIDGKNITDSNTLISEVQSHNAGDVVAVTVEREGQSIEIKTQLE